MAGSDDDKDSKTEEPTERKISEAAEKGNLPFAKEAVTFGSLLATLACLTWLVEAQAPAVVALLAGLLEQAGRIRLSAREDAAAGLGGVAMAIGLPILGLVLVIAAGGALAALVQNVPQAASERVQPKMSRISPLQGARRIFGLHGWVEFGKTIAKLAAVLVIVALVLWSETDGLVRLLHTDPAVLPSAILHLLIRIMAPLCLVAFLLAIFDLAWSRFDWRKNLRMSREELKEEFRQQEGDPFLKAKVRNAARQKVAHNMFARLPTATMVVTNPTHYAVALRYVREEGGAPVIVAKGADHLALRIREAAAGHGIPVVENKPLAQGLYGSVDIGQAIPPEFYRAVAEIIHYLQMRGRYMSAMTSP